MRPFATTMTIVVLGVIASKVIAGYAESPLHNRFSGELLIENKFLGKSSGLDITIELAKSGIYAEYLVVNIDGPEVVARSLGLEPGRSVCEVVKTYNQDKRNHQDTIQRHLSTEGDSNTCRKFYLGMNYSGSARTYFDANGLRLHAFLKRDNSRNAVGWMQTYWKDWR